MSSIHDYRFNNCTIALIYYIMYDLIKLAHIYYPFYLSNDIK